ncbi:MAG: cobaltochelatase subunit CobN [Hyphomicrobiaceae bacterium]|nr:cobaltochelatase subunit CobN [Hyphomicrobiaceae bacterium]
MHVLAAQSGVIGDTIEPVDLEQSPADIVVISAADSELAALARARDEFDAAPSLRLANFMALNHNLSVDLYIEKTLRHARLIVLRLLGGASYWQYGLEQIEALARDQNIPLVVLPGDARPDDALVARSTVSEPDTLRLWEYFTQGGPENMGNLLRACTAILGEGEEPPAPRPLLKAGLYWLETTNPALTDLRQHWKEGAPVAAITFYRALIEGANTAPVDAIIEALGVRGINALPIFVSSLKDEVSAATVRELLTATSPGIILNATGFAVSSVNGADGADTGPFADTDCPVLQMVFAGSSRAAWEDGTQGLTARDLAMNVVLPELDGKVLTRAVSFKSDTARHEATQTNIVTYEPVPDRVAFVAELAANWIGLRETPANNRRVAIILANYPNRDGRIGNGVGYDTPASTVNLLKALQRDGYLTNDLPADGADLMTRLFDGRTNDVGRISSSDARLSIDRYERFFATLPEDARRDIEERWGAPEQDPFVRNGAFELPVHRYGNICVAVQPARGYNIDPGETYHDPALVPPHGYLAFYFWLREEFGVHAVLHNGKHGNLEWLPGKALALSASCFPEAALGPVPNVYAFIVNDPGEGTQAKRRTSAVIVDHLTPPLTRAETYGPLKDLEALIDEYYLAHGLDPNRVAILREHILDLVQSSGLDADSGISKADDENTALQKLDTYICELKEAQIRDGLHILGEAPSGRQEADLLVALTRVPRGLGADGDQSLIRALAEDLELDDFDPLDCEMGAAWNGAKPDPLATILNDPWRTSGDTVERLELLAAALVTGDVTCSSSWQATRAVLNEIDQSVRPNLVQSANNEISSCLAGFAGRFVQPGPSGAPTRGRLDVLPTGRNFYSIDNRTLPTPAAWTLGQKSAERLVERHLQDHGRWPKAIGLTAWGTSNMRTGGDDIAQALALIGAKPVWDTSSWRVTAYEIIPLAKLGRPRVDVTLRISGFFRDAFPAQIELFDTAIRAVGALDEEPADNPIAARMRDDSDEAMAQGLSEEKSQHVAGLRIFGSKPGAYGAGLQALIDERLWDERGDFAESYIGWGGYAYGKGTEGEQQHDAFTLRLKHIEAVVQNQDNREHDLLDSDDYYQFEGGMTAAIEHVSGARPAVYHNDHSRPQRPVIRTLEEEIGRVVRSRVVNPKWIEGVMRHGYKGAFEIIATVDYMFAFAATTGAVRDHHFELAYDAFIGNETVRDFIGENNPPGLKELAERFTEALERELWTPRSNSVYHQLKAITGEPQSEFAGAAE